MSRSDRFPRPVASRRESRRSPALIERPALAPSFPQSHSFFSFLPRSHSSSPTCGWSAVHLRSTTGTAIFVLLPHPPRPCPRPLPLSRFLSGYPLGSCSHVGSRKILCPRFSDESPTDKHDDQIVTAENAVRRLVKVFRRRIVTRGNYVSPSIHSFSILSRILF